MNKALIGVMSCERDSANGCHDARRRTRAAHMVAGLDYDEYFVNGGVVGARSGPDYSANNFWN